MNKWYLDFKVNVDIMELLQEEWISIHNY